MLVFWFQELQIDTFTSRLIRYLSQFGYECVCVQIFFSYVNANWYQTVDMNMIKRF